MRLSNSLLPGVKMDASDDSRGRSSAIALVFSAMIVSKCEASTGTGDRKLKREKAPTRPESNMIETKRRTAAGRPERAVIRCVDGYGGGATKVAAVVLQSHYTT